MASGRSTKTTVTAVTDSTGRGSGLWVPALVGQAIDYLTAGSANGTLT